MMPVSFVSLIAFGVAEPGIAALETGRRCGGERIEGAVASAAAEPLHVFGCPQRWTWMQPQRRQATAAAGRWLRSATNRRLPLVRCFEGADGLDHECQQLTDRESIPNSIRLELEPRSK